MKRAFIPFDERLQIINEMMKPRYAALAAEAVARRRLDPRPLVPWRSLAGICYASQP